MNLAIIDSNYSKSEYHSLAASWLRWELKNAGIDECNPDEADILLATISSQQGISKLRWQLRKIKNDDAKVILGGGGAYAPAIFDNIADVVCVGEGAEFIRVLLTGGYSSVLPLSEAWIPGDTREVIPNVGFPWGLPPIRHPDGTIRVFGARGCRYRCLFCQTGWESSYRPNPNLYRLQCQIDKLEHDGARIAIITNDGAEESVRIRGQQEFVSMRLHNLMSIMPITRQYTKSVRIGVEGISERLRVAVGKPVKNDDLLSTTFDLLANSVGVRWFFIPGLPGEIDDDYDDLRYLVNQLKKLSKGVVMMNFHSFIPQPATPLCILPLVDDYWERFDEFRRWFFHGPGFTRHVQIVAPNKYPSRLKRSKESMAATEEELRRGWFYHDNKNWRVKYLMPPDKLRRIAMSYAEKVGLRLNENDSHFLKHSSAPQVILGVPSAHLLDGLDLQTGHRPVS